MKKKPVQSIIKRGIDIVGATTGLVVLSPVMAAVAVAIKAESKGPVFFRQKRVGLNGQEFDFFKFRSMCDGADDMKESLQDKNEMSGPVFKIRNDPRVTKVGRFLRKHSLDELPQLFNVLRGEMALVGPRPPVPKEVEKYEPHHRKRLAVRPGLTCYWQVLGRNEIPFEKQVEMDVKYVDGWTVAEDLRLVLMTIPVVVTGKGAS